MSTSNVELATHLLRERYADHVPRLRGSRESFRFESDAVITNQVVFDRFVHTMAMQTVGEPFEALVAITPAAPRFSLGHAAREIQPAMGHSVLADPAEPSIASWDDVAMDLVRVELDTVRELAGQHAGLAPEEVRFSLSRPLSLARDRYWQAVVRHVRDDVFGVPEVAASPLVRAESLRVLVAALVTTFPNTALEAMTDPTRSGPGAAEPATVRRAAAYIEEHAGEPIGITEIAQAARIGVPALEQAYRTHRGTTPLDDLRRVRMEGAHRDLKIADPTVGDTVNTVAARWGFAHPGRFAVEYRRVYDQSPAETLRA